MQTYLSNIGIDVLTSFSVAEVVGDAGAMRVVSEDGAQMEADLIIVAAGITPNVQLAVDAGLDAARGILVDERMRTSDEAIYAVGDCASVGGIVDGLWPSAVHQAEIAARNCLGDHAVYVREAPQTMLKVVGVDLVSLGRFPEDGDRVFVEEDGDHQRYRKLVVDQDGCAVGAISLGHPNDVPVLKQWIAERADVSGFLSRLEKADWSCLAEPTRSSQ